MMVNVADSPYIEEAGATPPLRLAKRKAQEAIVSSESSRQARRALTSSRVPVSMADLATTREYKKEINAKLPAASITPELSFRVLSYYLRLQEEHFVKEQKNGHKLSTYGAKIREQVEKAFGISTSTLQKIIDTFDAKGEGYETVRSGNRGKRDSRIPQTASVRTKVEVLFREKHSRGENVSGRHVLDFLVAEGILHVPKDAGGCYEAKSLASARKATSRWLEKNGFNVQPASSNGDPAA